MPRYTDARKQFPAIILPGAVEPPAPPGGIPYPLGMDLESAQTFDPYAWVDALFALSEMDQKCTLAVSGADAILAAHPTGGGAQLLSLSEGRKITVTMSIPDLVFPGATDAGWGPLGVVITTLPLLDAYRISLEYRLSIDTAPPTHQFSIKERSWEDAHIIDMPAAPGSVTVFELEFLAGGIFAVKQDGVAVSLAENTYMPGDYIIYVRGEDSVGFTDDTYGDPTNLGKLFSVQLAVS